MNKSELIQTIRKNKETLREMTLKIRGTYRSSLKEFGNSILEFVDEDDRNTYDFEIIVSKAEIIFGEGLVVSQKKLTFDEEVNIEEYNTINIYNSYSPKKERTSEELMQEYYKSNKTEF